MKRTPHPGPTAIELRLPRVNGLLSPALSSKGGEGEETTGPRESSLILMAVLPRPLPPPPAGRGGWRGSACINLQTYVHNKPRHLNQKTGLPLPADVLRA